MASGLIDIAHFAVGSTAGIVPTQTYEEQGASSRSSSAAPLRVSGGELVEVGGEGFAAFEREGVVDRGSEPADGAVSLQAVHLALGCACEERFLQLGVLQAEGDVHQRAIGGVGDGRFVEVGVLV